MAFKLLEMAEQRWRRLDGAHLLPLVRANVKFVDGVQVERHDENTTTPQSLVWYTVELPCSRPGVAKNAQNGLFWMRLG